MSDSNISNKFFGRRKIFTGETNITRKNVISEVNKALSLHSINLLEEDYLYWYRRGRQPILQRVKEVRPEICAKIVVNNAEQVCVFKNGYFLQKPISYVSRREDDETNQMVRQLNEYLYTAGKAIADNAVVNWFHTVGLGVLYVEPNRAEIKNKPANVYALDPRSAFVVYSFQPGNRPVMGINTVIDGAYCYIDVYTEHNVFRLLGSYIGQSVDGYQQQITMTATKVNKVEANVLGLIPIIEYQYNENRMSAFEPAMSIMDAINTVESNRVDGVEQMVQQLCVATNCQFEEGVTANTIRESGMICIRSTTENKADFKILSEPIDQQQTQVTLDDLYMQMLFKCSMPTNTSGGKSTSDTGTAVYLRDGFQTADTAARNTQDLFEQSNALFDEVFLKILQLKGLTKLTSEDFELKMERNSTSNLLVKTQAAMNMKELGLAPQVVLERSGLSSDPLTDIEVSRKYLDIKWSNEKPEEPGVDNPGDGSNPNQGNIVRSYTRRNPVD